MVVNIICTVIIAICLAAIGLLTYKKNVANKYLNLSLWKTYWILYWGLVAVTVLCIVNTFIPII